MRSQKYVMFSKSSSLVFTVFNTKAEMLRAVQEESIGAIEVYALGERVKFREQPRVIEDLDEAAEPGPDNG